jgi:hypothetical protein
MKKKADKLRWKKGETPHCEIESVSFSRNPKMAVTIRLTPRGARYERAWQRRYRAEQARIRRFNARHPSIGAFLMYEKLFSWPAW